MKIESNLTETNLAMLKKSCALCLGKHRLSAADFCQPEHHDGKQDDDDVHRLLNELRQCSKSICRHDCNCKLVINMRCEGAPATTPTCG